MADDPSYFERLKFEHDLINNRLTWLLTSQTILFAAFGFVIDAGQAGDSKVRDLFLFVTPICGSAIAMLILIGILAGAIAKYKVWRDEQDRAGKTLKWGVRTWITVVALAPDVLLPIVFGSAWIYIAVGRP